MCLACDQAEQTAELATSVLAIGSLYKISDRKTVVWRRDESEI